MKVSVIGTGSWGTALACVLASNAHDICMWTRSQDMADSINVSHKNLRYLRDVVLDEKITASTSFELALKNTSAVVVVCPSAILREIACKIKPLISAQCPIIICSKGVEDKTGLLPIEVFEEVLGNADRISVLSGPNHAEEVSVGIYSATVIASSCVQSAKFFVDLFATSTFRPYISDDPAGVEICAAYKNVIAIAVGISYGLGFGDNTAALIMTRGQAEISRLVHAFGANAITCMGLAGSGDLIATCTSVHSRNRRFGKYLADGKTVEDFTRDTGMIVEGALACKTLQLLLKKYNVDAPIASAIYQVIWENKDPKRVASLLSERPLNQEFYGITWDAN